MTVDFKNYIVNKDVHTAVDHIIDDEVEKITYEGRTWTLAGKDNKFTQNVDVSKKVGIGFIVLNAIGLFFKCWRPSYRTNFNFALSRLNETASESIKNAADNASNAAKARFANDDAVATARFATENQTYIAQKNKRIDIKRNQDELIPLREEANQVRKELELKKEQLDVFTNKEKAFQSKIDNLKEALAPLSLLTLNSLLNKHDGEKQELANLTKDFEEKKLLLEDKKKSGISSFHISTLGKSENQLTEEVKKAADKLSSKGLELDATRKLIDQNLDKLNLKYPSTGLTSSNAKEFIEASIKDIEEDKRAYLKGTNQNWSKTSEEIQEAEKKLKLVEGRCKIREDEILRLGGSLSVVEAAPVVAIAIAEEVPLVIPSEPAGEIGVPEAAPLTVPTAEKLAKELTITPYENVNKVVAMIQEKTGSFRIANMWATLLWKFSDVHGDVVKEVSFADGNITINLKNNEKDFYRMWIRSFPSKEGGEGETIGGIVITLANQIVLTPKKDLLEVRSGYTNYVKIPGIWRFLARVAGLGEYTDVNTMSIVAKNKDDIGITAGAKGRSAEKVTNEQSLHANWIRGIVLKDNTPSEDILKQHEAAKDFTAKK
jgi:hypothetical protein